MSMINMIILSLMMIMILMTLSMKISKEEKESVDKNSNFECGFQSQSEKNTQLSSQFFMISIIFLIFDVEIALMLPIPFTESLSTLVNWNIIIIMMMLLMGTILEWKMGLVEWTK